MKRIVVTFLVSYDAEYLKISVPLVYPYIDKIVFALDRERLTWKGNKFELPGDLFNWAESIDIDKKISIYEDTFYIPGKNPLDNDSRQRQMAAEYAGMENTWHIQVDADEYVINFKEIISHLRTEEHTRKNCDGIMYMGKRIPLFKKDNKGFFYVDNGEDYEKVSLAASNPQYVAARKIIFREKSIMKVFVFHQTFARSYESLKWKLNNWGHSNDFNTQSYLNLWKAIDQYTYKYLANFHPTYAPSWKSLKYLQAENIEEFIRKFKMINSGINKSKDSLKKCRVSHLFLALLKKLIKRCLTKFFNNSYFI